RAGWGRSVNFRLGNLPLAGEEIEIAAFVGLPDMGGEHGTVAAKVAWRGLFPGRAAAVEFLLSDVEADGPRRPGHLDRVAGVHEWPWPGHGGLPRPMQGAGGGARAGYWPGPDGPPCAPGRLAQVFPGWEDCPPRHGGTGLWGRHS